MIRTDIETIIMAAGPVPSTIVLRERQGELSEDAPQRALSIQTGSFEAAAISYGIDAKHGGKMSSIPGDRPITHDLLLNTIKTMGGKLERVEINRFDAPIFYASLIITTPAAQDDDARPVREMAIDARPSDALALAVRANAPIYVEDDVMNRAGTAVHQKAGATEDEIKRFDQFVESLSPDDF